VYSIWTQNLKEEKDKELFRNRVTNSKAVLQRLDQIIDEQSKELTDSSVNINSFNNPNWALKQAYIQGYLARGKSLRKLMDLDQKET
jgi:flagellar biosynthesis chaperone FliJ